MVFGSISVINLKEKLLARTRKMITESDLLVVGDKVVVKLRHLGIEIPTSLEGELS